jgi:hypothetical protein
MLAENVTWSAYRVEKDGDPLDQILAAAKRFNQRTGKNPTKINVNPNFPATLRMKLAAKFEIHTTVPAWSHEVWIA